MNRIDPEVCYKKLSLEKLSISYTRLADPDPTFAKNVDPALKNTNMDAYSAHHVSIKGYRIRIIFFNADPYPRAAIKYLN